MESKFYTPKIEELCIGFECEIDQSEINKNFKWCEYTIGADYENITIARAISEVNRNGIRVKYLDSSDIESLGFKKSNKNSWCGYKDYFLGNINPEYPYFLFATIHVPIRDDMYKILVHRYYSEDEPIDEDDNYREPTCVYVGKIKNKSELSQLLKRLNIINE